MWVSSKPGIPRASAYTLLRLSDDIDATLFDEDPTVAAWWPNLQPIQVAWICSTIGGSAMF